MKKKKNRVEYTPLWEVFFPCIQFSAEITKESHSDWWIVSLPHNILSWRLKTTMFSTNSANLWAVITENEFKEFNKPLSNVFFSFQYPGSDIRLKKKWSWAELIVNGLVAISVTVNLSSITISYCERERKKCSLFPRFNAGTPKNLRTKINQQKFQNQEFFFFTALCFLQTESPMSIISFTLIVGKTMTKNAGKILILAQTTIFYMYCTTPTNIPISIIKLYWTVTRLYYEIINKNHESLTRYRNSEFVFWKVYICGYNFRQIKFHSESCQNISIYVTDYLIKIPWAIKVVCRTSRWELSILFGRQSLYVFGLILFEII